MDFTIDFKTRWSDFDANVHMRHNAYNDYAAEARMRLFNKFDINIEDFKKEHIGPILFEENTSFRKEIHLGEDISVHVQLTGLSKEGERWKMRQEILNSKGDIAAVINVYGAWIDLVKRKLSVPPKKFKQVFEEIEKTDTFEEIKLNKG